MEVRMMDRAQTVLIVVIVALACSCSESPQARAVKAVDKGRAAYQKKNYEVAVLHFKNAIQAQPREAEPYYQLGLAYLALGDPNAAYVQFRKAVELNPKHTGAQLKIAEMLVASQSKDYLQEALKLSEELVAKLPGDAEALNVLAAAELRMGKPESAEAHLEQAIRNSPDNLKSAIILAQSRLARHDTSGAEQVLKAAAEHLPKSPEPRYELGGFYLGLGKTAEAEQSYRLALAIEPKHGPTLLALAGMKTRAGQSAEAEQLYRQVSALPEPQYKPIHAFYLFQSGKQAEAVAEFQKLAEADPRDRNVRTQLVSAHLALNQVDEAKKILSDALKKNARDVDALLQRSRISIAGKNFTEAQNDLTQVLRFRPDSAEAHYLLSKVHLGRGQDAVRRQELNEALRIDPNYVNARIELAQALIGTGGASDALKLLEATPEEQRNVLGIVNQRNWALLALGRSDEARKGIDQAMAVEGWESLVQDAVLKLNRKDYNGARASAEKVLAQSPGQLAALNVLIDSYTAQGQLAAGLQKAREYAGKLPNSEAVQLFLGNLLAPRGDKEGARRAFEAAKAANPASTAADLALASMDEADGRRDAARARLASVLAAHPDNAAAHIISAQLDLAEGKTAPAIEQYRKAVQADATNTTALNNLAFILADSGNPEEALKYAQQAKQLAPDAPSVDDTLGWTYYKKGLYSLAVTHLESAVARQPMAVRQYHLAMAYSKAGDQKRGRQLFEAALKSNPNLPEARIAREMFAAK